MASCPAAGDTCLVDEPLIEYPNVTGRDDVDWLTEKPEFDEDDVGLLSYAFMQYSPDAINALSMLDVMLL